MYYQRHNPASDLRWFSKTSAARKVKPVSQKELHMVNDSPDLQTHVIAETDNYMAWTADEPDGETTYHLELNNVTLHFFREEWDEFIDLIRTFAEEP
jgi:hypothetical protein